MSNARFRVPTATNEPVLSYAPGTPERTALRTQCGAFAGEQFEIPLIIGGKEVRTGRTASSVMPHRHGHVLATWHKAGAAEVAADGALEPLPAPRAAPVVELQHAYAPGAVGLRADVRR